MIRLCIVGPSEEIIGGQAVAAARLSNRLSENARLKVSFLPVNPNLPIFLRPLKRVKYVRTIVTSIVYIWSLLVQVPRADVIHAFSASYWSFLLAPVPAMLLGRLFKKGVLLNYRSGEADDHLSRWRTAIPFCRLAHTIVVPSKYLVEVFARHGLPAQAVSNFVEVDRLPYRLRDPLRPIFLSNRNFEEHYNIRGILKAFHRIQVRVPRASLLVVGDGSMREQLHREARSLDLKNIEFIGPVQPTDMAAVYDRAEIYLNFPNIDNMPNSILEAAACGIPIVSSDAGGITCIVQDKVTALIVPRNDDEALADAAIQMFEEEGLANRLAASARAEIIRKYTWTTVQDKWLDTYQLLVREN